MLKMKSIIESSMKGSIDIDDAMDYVKKLIDTEEDEVRVFKYRTGLRLLTRLQQLRQGQITIKDFAVALRQYILYNKQKIRLSQDMAKDLKLISGDFGLLIDVDNEVFAEIKCPAWFKQEGYLEKAYNIKTLGNESFSIGDNMLTEMASYDDYRSLAQKIAVYNALNMPEGHTMLASLPTGSGKSLIGQMLAKFSKGITLVVVPTVALAIDQLRSANRLFKKSGIRRPPRAYYGGMSYSEKRKLLEDIQDNNISLLYISPEALIKGQFNEAILEAAENGYVDNLIIDEAHLVADWGQFFRTEFQFLSVYRKKLLKAANGKLKTLLLSATFTDYDVEVLRDLFSEEDSWIEIRADSLRQEPMYCVEVSKDEDIYEEHLLELVHILPRPLILYVVTREYADRWFDILLKNGFKNMEKFTGSTPTDEREKIIKDWTEDRLDLIIATSAFGMGVDKPDIRTILHACIPESPNRFYQEVGRGGRDGLSSLSVICAFPTEDKRIINDLTKNKVLKAETIASRWNGMYASRLPVSPNEIWIDTSVKPDHYEEDRRTGLKNINWNEYVILFLARHKFISIQDFIFDEEKRAYQIQISIENFNILDSDTFINLLEACREYERELVSNGLKDMKELVDRPFRICWANIFTEIYTLADEKCNGCPYCHRHMQRELLDEFGVKKIVNISNTILSEDNNIIENHMSVSRDLWIYFNAIDYKEIDEDVGELFKFLVRLGANRFIIPNSLSKERDLIKQLFTKIGDKKHFIFTLDEINQIIGLDNKLLLTGNFLILYGKEERENDNLFKIGNFLHSYHTNNNIIHFSSRELYIRSHRKNIGEIIEGYSREIYEFIKEVKNVI